MRCFALVLLSLCLFAGHAVALDVPCATAILGCSSAGGGGGIAAGDSTAFTGNNTFAGTSDFNGTPTAATFLSSLSVEQETPPAAPSAALAGGGAGNVDDGTHLYAYTCVDDVGETSIGTASAEFTMVDKSADGKVDLTSIAVCVSAQTASRKVYRTAAGTTTPFKLLTTLADNSTTTYEDDTADAGLGANSPAANTTSARIMFEGTADAFETRLGAIDPTVDRTVTLPDATMTVAGQDIDNAFSVAQALAAGGSVADDQQLVIGGGGAAEDGTIQQETALTPDAPGLLTGTVSRSWHVYEEADDGFDLNNGPCGTSACTDPTLIIHSANQATDEWISFEHDQTDGRIETGSGDLVLGPATGVVEITPNGNVVALHSAATEFASYNTGSGILQLGNQTSANIYTRQWSNLGGTNTVVAPLQVARMSTSSGGDLSAGLGSAVDLMSEVNGSAVPMFIGSMDAAWSDVVYATRTSYLAFNLMESGGEEEQFRITGQGIVSGTHSYTVADSGDGNPATDTLTPDGSVVLATCSDADSCDITMTETGVTSGQFLKIVCMTATPATCDFADTAGVTELAGAFAMDQYDTLGMVYASDRWVEISRSVN